MALLNAPLNHPVAYHERNYESDSGFSADDYSSVDPVAAASEITSVASRASKNKSVLKLNTRDDGTIITLDEKEVLADNVEDHGIEDDAGDIVEFQKNVDRRNPVVVSFQEDAEIQDARTQREQKQSIHFVTRRIKASWLDNTYQKAIARARARLAKGNWPQYPEEWRLPKAPLPARPDLTRTGPISSLQGGYLEVKRNRKERRKRSETFPRTKSDAKSAERRAHLPPIDALYDSLFANLSASFPSHLLRKRWETAAAASSSPSTSVSSDPNSTNYLPFIGTARLHPKELTPTVRRDDSSQPPKFCYGCAAEIDSHPGVKAPLVFLDNPADDANDDPGSIEHAQLVPQDSPSQQHVARVCYGCSLSKLPHIHVVKPRRVGGGYTMVRQAIEPYVGDTIKDGGSPQPSSYISADMSFDDDDVESHFDVEIEEEEKAMLDYINIAKLVEPTLPLPSIPREKPLPVPQCIMEKIRARDIKAISLHEQHCYACREALKHYWPEYFTLKDESDDSTSGVGTSIASEALEEEERRQEERRRQLEEARQLRLEEEARRKEEEAERRKNLYKPPKAFQIKKTEKKMTESKDPFSSERNLNIPQSEGFKLKKTEKQTTKFVEPARQETEWKEPRKFELRRTEPKTTSTDWKPPERPERLRPKTPPPPPPPPKGKKPTVPIEPKKREPPAKKPDPPPPPPPKPVEKPKPVVKPKEPPPQKSEPKPEPKPKPAPKPKEKPVKEPVKPKEVPKPKEPPKQKVQQEPKQKEPPPKKKEIPQKIEPAKKEAPKPVEKSKKVEEPPQKEKPVTKKEEPVKEKSKPVEKQKPNPVEKEKPKPVEKEKLKPVVKETPKPIEREKAKPVAKEKPKPVMKEQPKKEPRPAKKQEPPKKPLPAPPSDPNPPPPKEPTPPPPKDPTPEPPPRDPTPPPAPKPKKETKPRPEKKKPQKQKKKSKSKSNEEKLAKEYVKIPIIPYKTPDKDPPPPPKEEPRPPPIPDPPVAPIQEPIPSEPEPVIPLSLPAKETQPKPKSKVNPPKKTRRAKLPKRVRKEEKQLGVAAPMPVRPPPSDPWVMPDTGPRVADIQVPMFPVPLPVEPQLPPLPEISHPAPAPEPPEEPAPEPRKQPMQLPKQPEPIMWRRRPEYKPKKKKWRKVEASNPPGSPDQAVRDPLDYLAKYCIVHKERVPHYQRIFNSHLRSTGINIQDRTLRQWMSTTDKAAGDHDGDDQSETESVTTEQSSGYGSAIMRSSEVHLEFKSDLEEFQDTFKTTPMEVNEDDYVSPMKLSEDSVEKEGAKGDGKDDDVDSGRADSASSDSPERMLRARIASYGINDKFDVEERLDRSRFMLDRQAQKVTNLKEKVTQLEESRTKAIADIARTEFLEIFRFDWDPDAAAEAKKKKDKKSKKKKKDKDSKKSVPKSVIIDASDESGASAPSTSSTSLKPTEPVKTGGFQFPVLKNGTDQWVLSRMTDKQVAMAETDAEVCRLSVKKQITEERLEAANKQIKELEGEKKMLEDLETKMRENESSDRMASKPDFRRKQSTLFNMMNQEQPYEIETTNVENLLQKINSHLITEKECQYVYHVLDLPQRHRIDFKLFTIVAALSEKISRLDPFIKKLINKINFEALDVKMNRAKELFYLLEDEEEGGFPGEVPVRNLQVELEAGGLKREHADLVMTKFNREGKGRVDFLDFLTYIPLFIDLHENIVSDPLYASKDL